MNSLSLTGNALVAAKKDSSARLAMIGEGRQRYFGNIPSHRPFQLELLRWNHGCVDSEDPDEREEAEAFEQLQCLTGGYRYSTEGGPGGGVRWTPLELAGVFLRHHGKDALIWLPDAGPNLLVQSSLTAPWVLLEVARLERRRVIVDTVPKTHYNGDGSDLAVYAEVAMLGAVHPRLRIRDPMPHLTEGWLQSAAELRDVWQWDWREVRHGSPFEVAQAKFAYNAKYPLADAHRGFYGEVRWQWRWEEDGFGQLRIRNHCWRTETKVSFSAGDILYSIAGDERSLQTLASAH